MNRKTNYSDLAEEYDVLFEPKQFDEFEDKLFNGEIDVDTIDLHKLFQEKNESALISIANYDYLYTNYGDITMTCTNYLVQLDNIIGHLKLANYYYEFKHDTEKALQIYLYYGNTKQCAKCFYNAASIYYDQKKYRKANKMLNNAIALNKNSSYYALKFHACLTLTHWPIAIYSLYKAIELSHPMPIVSPIPHTIVTSAATSDVSLKPSAIQIVNAYLDKSRHHSADTSDVSLKPSAIQIVNAYLDKSRLF